MHVYNGHQLYSHPLPLQLLLYPPHVSLPTSWLFKSVYNPLCPIYASHTWMGVGPPTGVWATYQGRLSLLHAIICHWLSARGGGSWTPPPSVLDRWLAWSCADNHSCCTEDTVPPWSFPTSDSYSLSAQSSEVVQSSALGGKGVIWISHFQPNTLLDLVPCTLIGCESQNEF